MPTRYAIGVLFDDGPHVMLSESCDPKLWWASATHASREAAEEHCKKYTSKSFVSFVIEFTYGEE